MAADKDELITKLIQAQKKMDKLCEEFDRTRRLPDSPLHRDVCKRLNRHSELKRKLEASVKSAGIALY